MAQPAFSSSQLTKPTEIRLLSVHAGAYQDDIHCDLVSGELANLPYKYKALSYVWGDRSKPCKIHVGSSEQVLQSHSESRRCAALSEAHRQVALGLGRRDLHRPDQHPRAQRPSCHDGAHLQDRILSRCGPGQGYREG
jgi:hypothetical protein